jgi:crossover junction endodeoxyribonuclease RuvC
VFIPFHLWFQRILGFTVISPMKILGIDPGLRLTGYGLIESAGMTPRLIDAGVIKLATRTPISARLVDLEKSLEEILDEHRPGICAIEQLYSHYGHPRTAILMGHARGVIMLAAARREIVIHEYAANRVKQSVAGFGHAGKISMQRAIASVWNLKTLPEPPDVADALAVALCCARDLATRKKIPGGILTADERG